jgi:hypothetical protein
MATAQS